MGGYPGVWGGSKKSKKSDGGVPWGRSGSEGGYLVVGRGLAGGSKKMKKMGGGVVWGLGGYFSKSVEKVEISKKVKKSEKKVLL